MQPHAIHNQTTTLTPLYPFDWQTPETARLRSAANQLTSITLEEMDSVKLMNRIDRKYTLNKLALPEILDKVRDEYRILVVEGYRLNDYRTVYFDTEEFELYARHVTKRKNRYKVRQREYLSSNQVFLEIKQKTNNGHTIKTRVEANHFTEIFDRQKEIGVSLADEWMQLEAKLWNNFTRITLVSRTNQERVTIDTDITVSSPNGYRSLGNIAVAEIKTSSAGTHSRITEILKSRRYHAQSFSKYAVGVALLYDNVKKNSMKPLLLRLGKIIERDL